MIERVRARFAASAGLRGIGKMSVASAIGQIAIMSTLPIATRLYAPAEYGAYSLLASFTGIATVAACLCLDLAIVQGRDSEAADELFAAALRSVPLTSLVCAIVLTGLIRGRLFGFGALSFASVPIACAMIALNGIYLASRYRQLKDHRFGLIASASLSQNLGRAIAPILWNPVSNGWIGLALGELTGRSLGTRRLLMPLLNRGLKNAAFSSWARWWKVVRREWRYTGILLASVLIDSSSSLIVAPMLAGAYGARAAGEYFLITTLLNAPLALIGTAFADVIHARSAALAISAPGELPGFVRRSAGALLLLGIVIYLPVYGLAPIVLPVIFGSKWTLIVPIARALTPFMIMALVASPCSRVLLAVRRTDVKMTADVVRMLVAPTTIILASHAHLPFVSAIGYFGIAMTGAYALYFVAEYVSAVLVSRSGGSLGTEGTSSPVLSNVQE